MSLQRFTFVLLSLAVLTLGLGCGPDSSSDSAEATTKMTPSNAPTGLQSSTEPTPAPDLTLETMDGESIPLAQSADRVLLVNFWATWCPPCRKEIPDLVDLQNELGERGLTVVGVAMDEEGEEVVRPFLDEYGVNYPIVLDTTSTISQQFGDVMGLPTTFVIGPDGQIQRRILGIFPVDDLKPELIQMLDEGAPAS